MHAEILNIVIAMHSLNLTVYEFLFIFDAIPYWERAQPAYRKVRLIGNVLESIRKSKKVEIDVTSKKMK